MLYPEGKAGKKRIGEDMRDLIEDALSLPRGTLDNQFDVPGGLAATPPTEPSIPALNAIKPAAAAAARTTLDRLDEAEKELVDLFRRATEEGKNIIHRVATTVEKTDD